MALHRKGAIQRQPEALMLRVRPLRQLQQVRAQRINAAHFGGSGDKQRRLRVATLNYATMLPFDFRCVTETYGLCINNFF